MEGLERVGCKGGGDLRGLGVRGGGWWRDLRGLGVRGGGT